MAFQQPAFMVAHPASALAIAAITARNSGTFTDDSKRALIDSRQGEAAAFTATGANAGFAIDFGTTSAAGSVNRCVIPAGHAFGGETLEIISDNSGVTLPSPSIRSTQAVVGSDVLDYSFGPVTADRYWGLQVTTSAAEVFTLGEYWIGNRKALTSGDAMIDPSWTREYADNLRSDSFAGRDVTLELSPPRRAFSLHIRNLDPAGTDFATLEEVILAGRSSPIWYWTPDSTDTGPYLVRLSRAARREQMSDVPSVSVRYEVRLELVEQLT